MNYTQQYRANLLQTLADVDVSRIDQAIEWLRQARDQDQQVFTCGNGGSASTASHIVCDLIKGASYQKPKRFRATALTDLVPTIMAYANDVSFESVFVEPLKNSAKPKDLLIAISGSGNSPNVLRAVEYANGLGCRTIGLTGRDGGKLGEIAQLEIRIPDTHMGRIEDGHMIICHILAYAFMDSPAVAATR